MNSNPHKQPLKKVWHMIHTKKNYISTDSSHWLFTHRLPLFLQCLSVEVFMPGFKRTTITKLQLSWWIYMEMDIYMCIQGNYMAYQALTTHPKLTVQSYMYQRQKKTMTTLNYNSSYSQISTETQTVYLRAQTHKHEHTCPGLQKEAFWQTWVLEVQICEAS